MSFHKVGGKEHSNAFLVVTGKGRKLQPEDDVPLEALTSPFEVYLSHSLILSRLLQGFSIDRMVAKSYTYRSAYHHPVIEKMENPRKVDIKSSFNANGVTQIFWCSLIAREYFSLLSKVEVPLETAETFEVSYWNNPKIAGIEVAGNMEEAIEKVKEKTQIEKLILTASGFGGQFNLLSDDKLVAVIKQTPTMHYRVMANETASL